MIETKVVVKNRAGLHARPAAVLVECAQKFSSHIILKNDAIEANAKSIMNIFTLTATYQSELILTADGEDEKEAIDEISELFSSRFELLD